MNSLSEPKEKILQHLADVYVDKGPWNIDYDEIDDAHGYAISEELDMHRSSVSRHLDQLKEDGLIEEVEREGERGTSRKIYTLTDKGWMMMYMLNPT